MQEMRQIEMALPIFESRGCGSIFEFDDRVFASISQGCMHVPCTAVHEKERCDIIKGVTRLGEQTDDTRSQSFFLADNALCDAPRLGL